MNGAAVPDHRRLGVLKRRMPPGLGAAATAADAAAPSAGVCGEPAISIGYPRTSA